MSSEIAWIFMLALLCAACGAQRWRRDAHKRGAARVKHFFERRMNAAANRARAASLEADTVSGLGELLRRANVRSPRAAFSIWALVTGAIAFACSARVGPAMSLAALAASALCACAILSWRAQKRRQQIVRQLPAFLEDIVGLVTIGSSVQAAFQAAAANTQTPLAECLEPIMPRLRSGADIDQALASVARIYRVQEFELIGAVLRISIKFGGGSDIVLERMAELMRDRGQADRAFIAPPSETRLSSWMLGLLPLMLGGAAIVLNSHYFESMWADPPGRKLVYGALALQAIGAFLLYRLARLRD